jgi:hypothetical protein
VLVDVSKIRNARIATIQAGLSRDKLSGGILVDPGLLKVAALHCKGSLYILIKDVLGFVPYDKVIVNSYDSLVEIDGSGEMPRLDRMLSESVAIVGCAVMERRGVALKYIGSVVNFNFEIDTGFIIKLMVISNLQRGLKMLLGESSISPKMIDRNQIVEMYPGRIIVSPNVNDMLKSESKEHVQGLTGLKRRSGELVPVTQALRMGQ